MSDTPKVATPHDALIAQLLDPNEPKTEREHAAARELAAAKADAERLRAAARFFLQCYDEAPQDLNVKYHAAEFRAAITTKEKS
jgi:hypothetical protein